eukprot:968474-Pyramimonas_sp.AAC.1
MVSLRPLWHTPRMFRGPEGVAPTVSVCVRMAPPLRFGAHRARFVAPIRTAHSSIPLAVRRL